VDDNPSIHRIAESLLAPTDVELVCVDSAAEALDRIGRGERFDVALVDTAMPGMDGWTLLERLRAMEETARMPIALMAGVLDPVDPAKLAKAPVQGFLKKPIELRELGDRVRNLLATPVPTAPSPFSTVPATPASDLMRRAEPALPEFRPVPEPGPEPTPAVLPDLPGEDEDLLVLDAGDLWPEEPVTPEAQPSLPAASDVHLELEELDLDSLQDLTGTPPAEPPAAGAAGHAAEFPAFPDEDDQLVTLSGLEALDVLGEPVHEPIPEPAHESPHEPSVVSAPPTPEPSSAAPAAVAAVAGLAAAGWALHHEHEAPAPIPDHVAPSPAPAADGQAPAAPGQAPATKEQAQVLVQALLADPVMVDALVKAVVARMGDQVIREIAWEVMPDLAGRLQR